MVGRVRFFPRSQNKRTGSLFSERVTLLLMLCLLGGLHTSELQDDSDWARLNLQSVTEQSSLDEFLSTAALAGTEFAAEKLNIKFVAAEARAGLLSAEEKERLQNLHEENKRFLRIPRRPHWDDGTTPEALQQAERDTFLTWRRELARLEEEQKLILTPYERNLDFWRQLWRVIERSDVVVQIVDARNPLLFRCPDLESYVKEVSPDKENMLLLNKADLLTREQRHIWAKHFEREGIRAAFWSALAENKRLEAEDKVVYQESNTPPDKEVTGHFTVGDEQQQEEEGDDALEEGDEFESCVDEEDWQTCSEGSDGEEAEKDGSSPAVFHNTSRLLRRDELLNVFRAAHTGRTLKEGQITVGLVGYPNVGKSSTINTILRNKKVSVSATPGHTKHFQTLFVEPGLCLCDCPGLVMPSFVSTKAEMICNGILPIDQMRDHVPAVSLISFTIPRQMLEGTYGINIIRPREDEDPERPPTAEELLMAYGYMRGFMTAHGQPDQSRSARYILKDYVSGKLPYCHPPPHIDAKDFQPQHSKFKNQEGNVGQEFSKTVNKQHKVKKIENVVDKHFFHQENVRALTKGVQSVMGYKPGSGPAPQERSGPEQPAGKPWKKHGNRNKKEKVRRLTKHLDA
uniref:Large subunit GTPase 1 homolog n=1 Tax=Scleropages formosus TaxID=113540 RepID=A0A8C9W630_SCLFO